MTFSGLELTQVAIMIHHTSNNSIRSCSNRMSASSLLVMIFQCLCGVILETDGNSRILMWPNLSMSPFHSKGKLVTGARRIYS